MKIIVVLFHLTLFLTLIQARSVVGKDRAKRSDDPAALQTVVDQLVQRVTQLEAQTSGMETDVAQLKTKRCETGTSALTPHDKTELVNGQYTERRHTLHVPFSQPFSSTPWVSVSLKSIDEKSTTNLRVYAGAAGVGTTGFDVFVFEWADTTLYRVTVSWIACTV